MSSSKILVILCYCGPRRAQFNMYYKDPLFFLKMQLMYLSKVKNNVDKIVFVINTCIHSRNLDYEKVFKDAGFPFSTNNILFRDNLGYSYGAFAEAFKKYRTEFDYYIYHEDDWLWVDDYWDTTLEHLIIEKSVNYLVGGLGKEGNLKFGSISEGIIESQILEKVFIKNGTLPIPNTKFNFNYSSVQNSGQKGLGFEICKVGGEISDWLDKYRTLFWCAHKGLVEMNPNNITRDLVLPIQGLDFKNTESYLKRISRDGKLI